jgi:hypothetical protein
VIRVTLEQPERKETPETQAPRAKLGRKVCREFREFKVYREKLVQPELMELTGIRC